MLDVLDGHFRPNTANQSLTTISVFFSLRWWQSVWQHALEGVAFLDVFVLVYWVRFVL
jgi:hypothetical protein